MSLPHLQLDRFPNFNGMKIKLGKNSNRNHQLVTKNSIVQLSTNLPFFLQSSNKFQRCVVELLPQEEQQRRSDKDGHDPLELLMVIGFDSPMQIISESRPCQDTYPIAIMEPPHASTVGRGIPGLNASLALQNINASSKIGVNDDSS
ncbi:hypothetical protein NPIL_262551 [Nephila pilipes]|uniref:Uncharacterized protein n=1 Tax=Nephila pilipes TaxID=299642 RepID=A0A8X6Q214_NEPPI|nr:hypothetical protein NPIL_262551 [Nephila pilipes]